MINVRAADGVTVLELERGAVNALDLELLEALIDAVGGATGPLVVIGAGRAFSAGVDLSRIVNDGDDYIEHFLHALSKLFRALFTYPHPTVAAVNGHAIAGGAILAWCCDVRLMSAGTIGLAELPVGVAFPVVALEVVRHALGPAATRAVLLGASSDPHDALRLGMVDEVTSPDALLGEATARARTLAAVPPDLYAKTKKELQAPALAAIDNGSDTALAVWQAPETKQRLADYLASLANRKR